MAKNAKVAPTACLNGPLIIDEEAEIRHCAFVRGNAIVGKGAVVGNSTELKNVVLFNKVQVPHYIMWETACWALSLIWEPAPLLPM